MLRLRAVRVFSILVLCAFFSTGASKCGSSPAPVDPPKQKFPTWYNELTGLSGVNLSHVVPGWGLRTEILENPGFVRNISGMDWNTFRLPVAWQSYVDSSGALDDRKIAEARAVIELLVRKLKVAHDSQATKHRFFLIVDFHHYKFGPACGGDGIPVGKVSAGGLNPADGNCVFTGFNKFWSNDQGVQDGWIEFAKRFVAMLPSLAKDNADWLTFGVEPINEPFAGISQPLFVSNQLQTALNFALYFSNGQPGQISSSLIPFYKKFAEGLKAIPGFEEFASRSLFVMDPFLLDHLNIKFSVLGQTISLASDGAYDGMNSLFQVPGTQSPLYWIAGPHHYDGSYDEGFRSFLPSAIADTVSKYPNVIYNSDQISARMQKQKDRFTAGGMDFFVGEWGSYTDLKNPDGSTGGYGTWIRDSKDAIAKYSRGHVWWQYHEDESPAQSAYYLIRTQDSSGHPIPAVDQVLKCGPDFDLVEKVFGKCVQ